MRVDIAADEIATGRRGSLLFGPLSLALNRTLPPPNWCVLGDYACRADRVPTVQGNRLELPADVREWLGRYEAGESVEPVGFEAGASAASHENTAN